jgi:hypothetical protein
MRARFTAYGSKRICSEACRTLSLVFVALAGALPNAKLILCSRNSSSVTGWDSSSIFFKSGSALTSPKNCFLSAMAFPLLFFFDSIIPLNQRVSIPSYPLRCVGSISGYTGVSFSWGLATRTKRQDARAALAARRKDVLPHGVYTAARRVGRNENSAERDFRR